MKIIVHANAVEWQREYLPRFTAGFVAHGHRVIHTAIDECDETGINVIFANNSWKKTWQQCANKHIPLITVGRALFGDRHDMVAIGWDNFNGAADFCLDDFMPTDRWEKHGHAIPGVKWNPDGYILVCGEFRDVKGWYETMREILAGEDVRFRPHPFKKGQTVAGWKDAPPAGQDDIASLFPDCRAVITYDSIAGCDAVLNGVASITHGENAMARPVSWTSWREFPTDFEEFMMIASRLPLDIWANRLAYCQWSHAEIEAGEFWTHLAKGCQKRMEIANAHFLKSHSEKMRTHHRLTNWSEWPKDSIIRREQRR